MTERTIVALALETLRPFAREAEFCAHGADGNRLISGDRVMTFTFGDTRRAAAAVEAIEKMKGDADASG